jgi:hypothetical protein
MLSLLRQFVRGLHAFIVTSRSGAVKLRVSPRSPAALWKSTRRKIEHSPARGSFDPRIPLRGANSDDSLSAAGLAGGQMDPTIERRATRRFSMMLPVKVRLPENGDGVERNGETRDVSYRGLYFITEASVQPGNSIEFVLTLPQQITLAGDVHIRCYAHVLRVEPHNTRSGVAARIDRYEFLPATA